jgi:ssDNA-binding Zn-finger/Zn-ribbon topoisomerase 1
MRKPIITKACPKCGVATPLVVRKNNTTGEEFLGCSNYMPGLPDHCTYTEPLPEALRMQQQGQPTLFDEEPTP